MNTAHPETTEPVPHPRQATPTWLVLPGMLTLVLLGLVAGRLVRPSSEVRGGETRPEETDRAPTPRPEGDIVSLSIDFGNGADRSYAALAWRNGMTVLDALQEAADFHPGIAFSYTGRGESAFLTSIDGVRNAGEAGGNWVYEIDGNKPQHGIGVATLEAGDRLLWRYTGSP